VASEWESALESEFVLALEWESVSEWESALEPESQAAELYCE
jgi:hypothetical protein